MTMDSLSAEDLSEIEIRKFFQSNKNICYHIAFSILKDEDRAEETVEEAMLRIRDFSLINKDMGKGHIQGLLAILTAYMAISIVKKEGLREEAFMEDDSALSGENNPELSLYIELLSKIPLRDRLILILSLTFDLTIKQISNLLYIKKVSVERRLDRAHHYLKNKLSNKEKDLLKDNELGRACNLWVRDRISSIEAVSNMDPHEFKRDLESRILDSMNKKPKPFMIYMKQFSANYKIIMAGLLTLAMLLSIILIKDLSASEKPLADQDADAKIIEGEKAQDSEIREDIRDSRYINNERAAYYSDHIVFIDDKDNKLYYKQKDTELQFIADLTGLIKEHFGVQYMAYMNDAFYLALLDGKGAVITGNPANIKIEKYWQSAWFDNQLDKSPFNRLSKDGIEYIFGADKQGESQ